MDKVGPPPASKDASRNYPNYVQQNNQQQQQFPQLHNQQLPPPIGNQTNGCQPEQQTSYLPNTTVIVGAPRVLQQVVVAPINTVEKSIVDAYVLCVTLGWLGAHHLYLKRPWFFVAYFFTLGLFGVGWLIDICRIPCLVKETNARIRDASRENRKQKVDAYILWFPFGLLGFHLFYLKRPAQGLLYFFTFGLLGFGWLVDLFRIPYMVKDCNNESKVQPEKSMFASYVLCVSPFGLLGLHHYYLNRPYWGLLYTFTFGLLGIGWIVDWFRCYHLVIRAREEESGKRDPGVKYYDDIYLLWFPLGWMGFHHFYLRRYTWGFLYFFTFGLFGIGWLIDFCRLTCMIKEYNKNLQANRELIRSAQQHITGHVNSRSSGDTLVTTNISPGLMVYPQASNYGATATQPQNGVFTTPVINYSQYPYPQQQQQLPNITYVQSTSGNPGGVPQHPQMSYHTPYPPAGNMGLQPPSYEEATHDNTESKGKSN